MLNKNPSQKYNNIEFERLNFVFGHNGHHGRILKFLRRQSSKQLQLKKPLEQINRHLAILQTHPQD